MHPVKRLALYQLAVMARSSMQQRGSGTGQDRTGAIQVVWRQHRAGAAVVHDSLPDLTEAIGVYRGYLRSIATMARELDVRLILVTQPALWREDLTEVEEAQLWLGGIGDFQAEPGHEYFASAALGRAMDAYNATLLGVCAELGVECVDVAAALPRDLDTFYDDVHFTEAGSRLVAEHLAEYLLGQPPYAPR